VKNGDFMQFCTNIGYIMYTVQVKDEVHIKQTATSMYLTFWIN